MEFKIEVDEGMYGISKCPHRTFEDIYLGGYFCWKMCKYHRGIDRENRIVKCDFPLEEYEPDKVNKGLAEANWRTPEKEYEIGVIDIDYN